ncbi:thiopeptide-type bacteriocin biosynthesis protein [Micromonospora taraxaci]|uniref:thiopeptide-type bacteriocin biosynthesis protein n=1 Tax=Micromonospora taraxaci TaxID=1316803 RepID=UPI0033B82D7F
MQGSSRPLPTPTPALAIGRDQGQTPAASRLLLAKLYGDIRRQDLLPAEHLPRLIAEWDAPPDWWFLWFRDPDQHLRLRTALPEPSALRPTAERVSAWAENLRRRKRRTASTPRAGPRRQDPPKRLSRHPQRDPRRRPERRHHAATSAP